MEAWKNDMASRPQGPLMRVRGPELSFVHRALHDVTPFDPSTVWDWGTASVLA